MNRFQQCSRIIIFKPHKSLTKDACELILSIQEFQTIYNRVIYGNYIQLVEKKWSYYSININTLLMNSKGNPLIVYEIKICCLFGYIQW